ncbi:MAG: hypothetical protein Q8P68_03515 [Candidatus Peregrinibacteria bacterium]|nr:hypothetical protein [Candidatus Peregrinibacteria bacterium]MDZ4245331.1 hypothetical protein [Candidatus Gracilibacteria bacterium]
MENTSLIENAKVKNVRPISELQENLDLIRRIKEGKEELFSGDLYELAELQELTNMASTNRDEDVLIAEEGMEDYLNLVDNAA